MTNRPTAPLLQRLTRLKPALIIAATWAVAAIALRSTPYGSTIEHSIANRAEFSVRETLGRAPAVAKSLKIFCFDDRALGKLQRPEMSFADWAALLDAIGKTKPRAVYIDQMFTFFPAGEDASVALFRDAVKRLGNVTVGSFIHSHTIPFRETLPLNRHEFRLETMTDGRLAQAAWLPQRSANVYGPNPLVRDAFASIGQILNPGFGEVEPLVRVNENTAVPYSALLGSGPLKVTSDGLSLDGKVVPLGREGRLPVNFPARDDLYQVTYSLTGQLDRARRGEAVRNLDAGDTVVILPLFYTGNHDVVDSPIGRVPGGLILSSVVNSTLTNAWLKPVEVAVPLSLVVAMLGALLGLWLSPVAFWLTFTVMATAMVAAGLGAFTYAGLIVPWLFPLLGFIGAALTGQALATASSIRETLRLKDALRGAVPEAKLKDILGNKGRLAREASERVVTLMFLDIANFSLVAQESPPKEVFLRLKDILRDVTKTIHRYGGTVDKTLGDGLLCFFGYSYDGELTENQADQAIRCAIDLQKENVQRCLDSARDGKPMLPFRIGLNTGAVYIGDLGNEDRIDFTVIGNGVNYAQRLEAACDHHALMISATTMDFATEFSPRQPGFTRRFIHVKHHEQLLEAIEYDPLHESPELRDKVLAEFRKTLNLERKEIRWPVDDAGRLSVETEFGPGLFADFSASGCCVVLPSFLAKGIVFNVGLKCRNEELDRKLRERGVAALRAEVRWGRSSSSGYVHGLKFLNLNDAQLATLFELLREVFQKNQQNLVS